MTPRVLLRVASIVTALFAAGHMMGAAESWSPPGETAVLQSMRAFSFDAGGSTRTYWDFYVGFGVYIGVLLALQAVLLWQMAAMGPEVYGKLRPMLAAMCAAWTAGTIVLWVFIFTVPAVFSLVCTLAMAAALLANGRTGAR